MEKRVPRQFITNTDRDKVVILHNRGLKTKDISDMLHISKSSVNYILQAYNACINADRVTLQKLIKLCRPTVDWAIKITNAAEIFRTPEPEPEPEPEIPEIDITDFEPENKEPTPVTVTREDFLAMYATLQDIRSLLIEIRDSVK